MTDAMEARAVTVFRALLKEGFLSVILSGTDDGVNLFRVKKNLNTEGMIREERIILHQAFWPASREEIIRRAEEKYRLLYAVQQPISSASSFFEFSKRSV